MSEYDLEALRAEVVDLNGKLKMAVDAQSQAAELGLELLKQRADLEQQIEILQKELDFTKLELTKTKKSLAQIRDQHKVVTDSELYHEQSFLEDSAKLEAKYGTKIAALESEARSLQERLKAYENEAERLQANSSINEERLNQLEVERKHLKEELKDLKSRDQILQNENNELEEENVNLQKQVSNLKSAQVEFEVMKMEISRFMEETVLLQAAADEANKLRSLAEKQEQEALASAQAEREQRLWLKREYERLHNDQHLSTLNHLIFGIDNNNTDENHTLKQLESSIISETPFDSLAFKSGGGQDLFSEIQGELSEKVAKLELENEELSNKMSVFQKSILHSITPLFCKFSIDIKEDCDFNTQFKGYVELALQRFDDQFSKEGGEAVDRKQINLLKGDLRQAILLGGLKNAELNSAHDRMIGLAQVLHQFYAEVAGGDEEEDNRKKVGEIVQRLRLIVETNIKKENIADSTNERTDVEISASTEIERNAGALNFLTHSVISKDYQEELSSKLSSNINTQVFNETDLRRKFVSVENDKLQIIFDSLNDLVRLVKSAAETTIQSKMAMEDKDKADIYQANTKLKSLLAVKREQVSSLRTVLRSNKTSTESALQCLRDKYESAKRLKDESMESLRKELKQFKEDAATFASHRAMFTARCEELQGQLESAQQSLKATEDEKRTLNQLLRMAIHQKIELTQRVEELEMERERQTQNWAGLKRPNSKQQSNVSASGSRHHGGGNGGQQMSRGNEMTRTVRYPQNAPNLSNNQTNNTGSRSAR